MHRLPAWAYHKFVVKLKGRLAVDFVISAIVSTAFSRLLATELCSQVAKVTAFPACPPLAGLVNTPTGDELVESTGMVAVVMTSWLRTVFHSAVIGGIGL